MAITDQEKVSADRKRRRELRRLAREVLAQAAEDMNLGMFAYCKLLKKRDEEAMAAFVLATQDVGGALVADWEEPDWENFFAMVIEFIMALMILFA